MLEHHAETSTSTDQPQRITTQSTDQHQQHTTINRPAPSTDQHQGIMRITSTQHQRINRPTSVHVQPTPLPRQTKRIDRPTLMHQRNQQTHQQTNTNALTDQILSLETFVVFAMNGKRVGCRQFLILKPSSLTKLAQPERLCSIIFLECEYDVCSKYRYRFCSKFDETRNGTISRYRS